MNILLTSVGRRSYIVNYFREALAGRGRVIVGNSVPTAAFALADAHYITPKIHDEGYIERLLEICRAEDVAAIVSLFDIDLPMLAQNAARFAAIGVRHVGPGLETALIANDKLRTRDFFLAQGIETPRTLDRLEDAISLLAAEEIAFPMVIKPRWGMGSIGIYTVEDMDELSILYRKCKRDVMASYLSFESRTDLDRAVMIQTFARGQEHGLDLFKDLDGTYCGVIAKRKIAMRSGETDVGEVVDPTPFLDAARRLAEGLDFTGLLSFDCFLDGDRVQGIEINPRISGHYPFSHIAGADYPRQLIGWLGGGATDPALLSARIGVRGCKELTPTLL